MAFPAEGWPPPVSSGVRSIRFFVRGTATLAFADRAYLFADGAGANTFSPLPYVPTGPSGATLTTVPKGPVGTGRNVHDATDLGGGSRSAVIKPAIWSHSIRICNDSSSPNELEFSFDGMNVAGVLLAGETVVYRNRHEAGICVRGSGTVFRIEAW